jgi:hypothetical protein
MNLGKTMATAAVAGMIAGLALACGGEQKPAEDPTSTAGKAACNDKSHCGATAHAEGASTAAASAASTAAAPAASAPAK